MRQDREPVFHAPKPLEKSLRNDNHDHKNSLSNFLRQGAGFLLFACFFCAFAGSGWCSAPPLPSGESSEQGHGNAADVTVARVNDVSISLKALLRRMETIKMARYGKREVDEQMARRLKSEAIDELVMEEVVYQQARNIAATVSAEDVASHIATLEENLGGREHFGKYLASLGFTMAEYREEAKRVIAVEKLVAKTIDERVLMDEATLEKTYKEKRDQFIQKEKVQIDDVIFFLDPNQKESFAQAEKFKKAIEESGDLGKVGEGDFYHIKTAVVLNENKEPILYEAAKKLPPHGVSEPIVSQGTLHIIKLTGYVPFKERTFEEVKGELKARLMGEMRREMLRRWMEDLRRDAKIDILLTEAP